MKNTFGQSVTLTLFGESHGPAVGAVLDGLAPGLPVDEEFLRRQLARRRPATAMDTPRREPDNYQILSGVWQGRTTGTPLTIVIPNENTRSGDYTYGLARPSHADYAAYCKYHGFEDWRGGGHFSGRVTAPLVAAGAIVLTVLRAAGVAGGTHILRCGGTVPLPTPPRTSPRWARPPSPHSIRRRVRRSAARFSPRGTRTTASAASRRPPSAACPPGWASRGSTASRAC